MLEDAGVNHIRLRGTNPQLAQLLPNLYALVPRCSTFGSFLDETLRYLTSMRLSIMTMEYNASTREVTLLVRG